MRATRPTGRPSPLRRSRWPAPSDQRRAARKGPRSRGALFFLLSFQLPRLAACRALAGSGGLLGRRLALCRRPLLAPSTARGLHFGDAFLFLLPLFDLGLVAQQAFNLRLFVFHLPWELPFFDA